MRRIVLVTLLALFLMGCTACMGHSTYNIYLEKDSIKYADTVTWTQDPGQGGDSSDSSAIAPEVAGGESLSPGINIINRDSPGFGVAFTFGSIPEGQLDAQVPLK